ncbi:MAG: class II glutamine amidotransferase [Polyangiaceae bacterium]
MCRLLGIVAAAPYDFNLVLCDAPRSMVALSHEHRDGWGMALHPGTPSGEWVFHKSTQTASEDPEFGKLAHATQGRVLIAHVRQKTVGPVRAENTHPFRRGRWVFAHNGTLTALEALRREVSESRRAEMDGDTDSELFFAYLLTRLDADGLTHEPVGPKTDEVVRRAVHDATSRGDFGTLDALLSDGVSLYAMRFGRPLYFLKREPATHAPHAGLVPIVERRCLVVASEPLTDEAWQLLDPGTLLRFEAGPIPLSTRVA